MRAARRRRVVLGAVGAGGLVAGAGGIAARRWIAGRADGVGSADSRDRAREPEPPLQVTAAITIRCDRDELYARWRDFEGFPDFMAHLEEVRSTGPSSVALEGARPARA